MGEYPEGGLALAPCIRGYARGVATCPEDGAWLIGGRG